MRSGGRPTTSPPSASPVALVDYVERTTSLAVTSYTRAGANTVITGNAFELDGATSIEVVFFCMGTSVPPGQQIDFALFDGATDLGTIAIWSNAGTIGNSGSPIWSEYVYTPAAGSHQYSLKAYDDSGAAAHSTMFAGAGGPSALLPALLLVRSWRT